MFTITLFSCNSKKSSIRQYHVCNCEQREKVASFISDNIKDANNMSDEEMEDVVRELRVSEIIIFCPQKSLYTFSGRVLDTTKNKLDSCESIMRMH